MKQPARAPDLGALHAFKAAQAAAQDWTGGNVTLSMHNATATSYSPTDLLNR